MASLSIPRRLMRCFFEVLRWVSPRTHYWVVSLCQPIRARFVIRKDPPIITARPLIVLVTGENGPDKLSVYSPAYDVYRALRPHFWVELKVHVSLSEKHVKRIAEMKPDLVLLSSDSGHWQQAFEEYNVPLMGCASDVSRLCYDKVAAKEAVLRLGISTMPWVVMKPGMPPAEVLTHLRLPVVTKPRRGGSSEGLSKLESLSALKKAIKRALRWDTEVLVEEYAPGREYTCTVYGNDTPVTLPLNRKIMRFEREEMGARGERVTRGRFPVLSEEAFVARIHALSKEVYRHLNCRDMIRIDWKHDPATGVLSFLEINTLPWIGRSGGNIEDCAIAIGSSYEEFVLSLFLDSLRRHRQPAIT